MKFLKVAFFSGLLLFFWTCKKEEPILEYPPVEVTNDVVSLNPYDLAPLTALITLQTDEPVSIQLKIVGKNGAESDFTHIFNEVKNSWEVPVLGLYSGFNNTVKLTFFDADGHDRGARTYAITTAALPADYPDISINQAKPEQMEMGMTLVSYFGHNGEFIPNRPFIFDRFGEIRWYLDVSRSTVIPNLFYDDGMERLQNGNFYFGDGNSASIYELSMLGEIVNSWPMPGYDFHHNVIEKPNGNFIVTVNKIGLPTIEDHLIEIDRNTKEIIREWDLNQSLNNQRRVYTDNEVDWVHVNAVVYDESDNTIIISGRTQGVVKLTEDNQVVWILGCHRDWGLAGNGVDLSNFLLQPIDANGQNISDATVLLGDQNHPNFAWPFYHHAPLLMPNGHLMLFDNGDNRNFTGGTRYSRSVEYDINAQDQTIRQVWSYGKERGEELFSRIVSDVDYLPTSNHVIMSSGSVNFNGFNYGKVIELDYNDQSIIFEATIRPPVAPFDITFHRTERLPLYPE